MVLRMPTRNAAPAVADTSNADQFVNRYAEESLSEATWARSKGIYDSVVHTIGAQSASRGLDVADIGCGAGTHSIYWASFKHRVQGIDVSERLVGIAGSRARQRGLSISFAVGTATALPWRSGCVDVCLLPELLEHVPEWQVCLAEAARLVRPGGALFVSTSNCLCPVQSEFDLPLYSWYPRPLKRHFERLAVTTRPEIAGHVTYPAVNWFTFYGLSNELESLGFECFDRFQTAIHAGSKLKELALKALRRASVLRFAAQFATPYTQVIAVKRYSSKGT